MAKKDETLRPLLVVPMTGVSARFSAEGYTVPKFMLELNGQLVIDHVLDMYPGWEDVVFICNSIHLDDPDLDLRAHLLSRRPRATIVRLDGAGRGPGDAILRAASAIELDRPIVVNYCDFTVYWNPDDLEALLAQEGVDGVIPAYTGFHPHTVFSTSYAYVRMDGDRVLDIQEKQPWTDDPHREWASTGTYGFSSGRLMLEALHAQVEQQLFLGGELYLSLTYKPLLARGLEVRILSVQHFMQWGTPQDLEEYRDISTALAGWSGPRLREAQTHEEWLRDSSRVILASGAGQRFVNAGYSTAKPLLELSARPVLEHVIASTPGSETVVVMRADLPDSGRISQIADEAGHSTVVLPGLSRGQAESALRGIEAVESEGPVTVAACDALAVMDTSAMARALKLIGEDGLAVWTAPRYSAAARTPEQYGWVASDKHGMAKDFWLKEAPGQNGRVMIGTFTFGSRATAMREIAGLIDSGHTLNGEFYLDSVARRMFDGNRRVATVPTASYVSVGTPNEYETVLYWQSCFHKWVHHSYSLVTDPLVPVDALARLDKDFRAHDVRVCLYA